MAVLDPVDQQLAVAGPALTAQVSGCDLRGLIRLIRGSDDKAGRPRFTPSKQGLSIRCQGQDIVKIRVEIEIARRLAAITRKIGDPGDVRVPVLLERNQARAVRSRK